MSDKIQKSYRQSRNIYDDVLTRSTWWSRLYMDFFWGGVDDNEIARTVLSYIPDDFSGKLLDALMLFKKHPWAYRVTLACGIILMLWIVLEWYVWGFVALSNIYFVLGLIEAAAALVCRRKGR